MGLIRSRGTWRREASFKTYLYRIAFNQCASEARRADFKANEPLEYPDGTVREVEAKGPTPDAEATRREEAAFVARALEGLDPDQREAIVLREYQGLSYEEIADLLEVAVGTVKSRIFRGKMELKKLLAPMLGAATGESGGKVLPMQSPSQ